MGLNLCRLDDMPPIVSSNISSIRERENEYMKNKKCDNKLFYQIAV